MRKVAGLSLKLNILAGYASQIYVTLVGIAILPLYIKYMGAESVLWHTASYFVR